MGQDYDLFAPSFVLLGEHAAERCIDPEKREEIARCAEKEPPVREIGRRGADGGDHEPGRRDSLKEISAGPEIPYRRIRYDLGGEAADCFVRGADDDQR